MTSHDNYNDPKDKSFFSTPNRDKKLDDVLGRIDSFQKAQAHTRAEIHEIKMMLLFLQKKVTFKTG
jgi:hypothetical protein